MAAAHLKKVGPGEGKGWKVIGANHKTNRGAFDNELGWQPVRTKAERNHTACYQQTVHQPASLMVGDCISVYAVAAGTSGKAPSILKRT